MIGPEKRDWKSPATGLVTAALAGVSFIVPGEAGRLLFLAGSAGFVGWGTNAVAIKMLFDRIRILGIPIPFTGVIPQKRRELIDSMSRSVAEHLLHPGAIREQVMKGDFVAALLEVARSRITAYAADDEAIAKILQEVSARGREVVKSGSVRDRVRRQVADRIHERGFLARALVDPDDVGSAILDSADRFLKDLPSDPDARAQVRALAGKLPEAGSEGSKAIEERLRPLAENMLETLLARIDVEKTVRENLDGFSDQEIKALVQRSTREHLGWLEVWGGVLGAIAGVAMHFLLRL